MIKSIAIEHFRCYEKLLIDKCARMNVIVGDNGSGKTALLEAIFLALGHSPELASRFRALRGMDTNMTGSAQSLERALWQDLFYKGDMQRHIFIKIVGSGPEDRSVRVARSSPRTKLVTIKASQHLAGVQRDDSGAHGVRFTWIDSHDNKHEQRASITSQGIHLEYVDNSVAESPNDYFYYIAASGAVNGNENASRFSELSISGQKEEFLKVFTKEYPWISDISVEMNGGIGTLYARVTEPFVASRPLAYVSSGINRVMSILLCIAMARDGVVVVDEIDNGIHHAHHASVWRMLISMCRQFNAQLIMTTHSLEWLRAMTEASSGNEEEFALWRVKRADGIVQVRQFGGKQAFVAIESGTEVR